jgi:hypothetical protein
MTATLNRLTPSMNAAAHKQSKSAKSKKPVADTKRTRAAAQAVRWAHRYALTAIVLSAGLNGYAASVEAPSIIGKGVGALLGAAVPVAVWLLAQLTAWTYRAGYQRLALLPCLVSAALLLLSVAHCASAFAALTGTGWLLSVCLAVGIDCGLVSSEAVAILAGAE